MSGTVRLIINGLPHESPIPAVNTRVESLVARVLSESGNTGQPAENWELRDRDGRLIDSGILIRDSGIVDGATFYLNPHAGWGGGDPIYLPPGDHTDESIMAAIAAAAK